MRRPWILTLILIAACGGDDPGSLRVDVRTDLVPGAEFQTLIVSVGSEENRRGTSVGENWVDSVVGGTFEGLALGNQEVRVELQERDGRVVIARRVVVRVTGTTVVTVPLTRDCIGVMCPGASGVAATECLGGECVEPGCSEETPELCPAPECMDDDECDAPVCGRARCVRGSCFAESDSDACDDADYCDPDRGCVPLPPEPDAGVDAGVDAEPDTSVRPPFPPVQLLSPANGTATGSPFVVDAPGEDPLSPLLNWAPNDEAGTYEVQVSDECDVESFIACPFDEPEISTRVILSQLRVSLSVSTEVPVGTRYYWRVRACPDAGECGEWSRIAYLDVGRQNNDYNGDGYADAVTTDATVGLLRSYNGSADGVSASPTNTIMPFSDLAITALASGDYDADGFADLVVGIADLNEPGASGGAVRVMRGRPAGLNAFPDVLIAPPVDQLGARFGEALAFAGDVDANGYPDLVVGAPGHDEGGALDVGRAYLFLSTRTEIASIPSRTLRPFPDGGASDAVAFGSAVGALGDFDGDGLWDWAVGAPGASAGDGSAFLYSGARIGMPDVLDFPTGPVGPGGFGTGFADRCDFNGDGRLDLAVASRTYGSPNDGAVLVLLADGAGDLRDRDLFTSPTDIRPRETYAASLACLGDMNGDGIDDLGVGASGEGRAGLLHAYVGYQDGDEEPVPFLGSHPRPGMGAGFGVSLSGIGDSNGDGYDDIVVGAPDGAWVFHGQDPLRNNPAVTLTTTSGLLVAARECSCMPAEG